MLSDEEKKAIEDLKEVIDLYNDGCLITIVDDIKSIDIVLNLIEKQSNEIEEIKKRKLQDMTFELQSIVGQYLMDFLKEIIKRDYISKKKLYEHIEMLEKENCHETCGIKKLIDCGRQCSIGCTIKNIKKILEE